MTENSSQPKDKPETTTPPAPPQPTNPYKEGTKKYFVAKALIAGEVDRGKIAKEVDVSLTTIYNITAEMGRLGYALAIHQRAPKPTVPPTTPTTSTIPPTQPTKSTHQKASPVKSVSNSESRSESRLPDEQLTGGDREVDSSEREDLTGEEESHPVSRSRSRKSSPGESTRGISEEDTEMIARKVY